MKFLEAATETYCASCYAIYRHSPLLIILDDLHNREPPFPLPTPYPTPSFTNDICESCSDDSYCKAECVSANNDSDLMYCSSYSDENCFCVDPIYDTSVRWNILFNFGLKATMKNMNTNK